MADVLDLNAEEFVEEDDGNIVIKLLGDSIQIKKLSIRDSCNP